MRIRNVKDASIIVEKSRYTIKDAKAGKKNIFNNDNPLMLEIGMGKGEFIIGMAKLHPDWNFIGIEKYESVLVRAIEKLEREDLPNVRVMSIDATSLNEYVNKEVDTIYLNFSDPWPKKRHNKRRLTYETFLKVYDEVFEGRPHIVMKTDNDGLFEGSLEYLSKYGYVLDKVFLDLHTSKIVNIETEYEKKFSSKGFKIKYLDAHKEK